MCVVHEKRLLDVIARKELSGHTCVFARNNVRLLERLERAQSYVAKVANRGRDYRENAHTLRDERIGYFINVAGPHRHDDVPFPCFSTERVLNSIKVHRASAGTFLSYALSDKLA